MAKNAAAFGRAQAAAMQRIAQADRLVFRRNFHEAPLGGQRIALLAGRLALGRQRKHDVVIDEAFGGAVAVQCVGHADTSSLAGAGLLRSRISLRPSRYWSWRGADCSPAFPGSVQ